MIPNYWLFPIDLRIVSASSASDLEISARPCSIWPFDNNCMIFSNYKLVYPLLSSSSERMKSYWNNWGKCHFETLRSPAFEWFIDFIGKFEFRDEKRLQFKRSSICSRFIHCMQNWFDWNTVRKRKEIFISHRYSNLIYEPNDFRLYWTARCERLKWKKQQ